MNLRQKHAALLKVAQARMAIAHVLRSRAMQKMAADPTAPKAPSPTLLEQLQQQAGNPIDWQTENWRTAGTPGATEFGVFREPDGTLHSYDGQPPLDATGNPLKRVRTGAEEAEAEANKFYGKLVANAIPKYPNANRIYAAQQATAKANGLQPGGRVSNDAVWDALESPWAQFQAIFGLGPYPKLVKDQSKALDRVESDRQRMLRNPYAKPNASTTITGPSTSQGNTYYFNKDSFPGPRK